MPQARLPVSLYLTAPGSRFWTASAPLTLEDALARAASLGYDAVEIMPRDVDDPDPEALRAAAERRGLRVLGFATGFIALEHGLTFTHPDPDARRQAVEMAGRCLEAARRAGASFVSVGLVRGKPHPGVLPGDAQAHLAACVRECGLRAGDMGLTITLEPGNRYETGFVHTVDEALALLEAVSLPSVLLQLDTFHMNIEEASIAGAIRHAGPRLAHLHLADSNRRAPGWGHLDFGPVVSALREVGYAGAIGLEILFTPDFEAAAGQGIRFVRSLLGDRLA
jgi:sugar phosphate isomerase/epimerase